MKPKSLLVIFLWAPGMLYAQLDSYRLDSYRLPDIRTHRLDIDFSGNGNTANTRRWTDPGDPENGSKQFTLNGNLSAAYSFYRNDQAYQGEQYLNLSIAPRVSTTDPPRLFTGSLEIRSVNRSYFGNGNFIHYGMEMDGYRQTSSRREQAGGTRGTLYGSGSMVIPLMIGHGRIDPVQDARLAVYILQDLQKAGRLEKVPGPVEIDEFAGLISRVKNQRFFDSREKLIWEIGQVNGWLESNGILNRNDTVTFTRLYDNWLYSSGPVREAGRRFSGGLEARIPSYLTNGHWDSTGRSVHRSFSTAIAGVVRWETAKPVSLTRQRGNLIELSLLVLRDGQADKETGMNGEWSEAVASAKYLYSGGWYPSSRTAFEWRAGGTSYFVRQFLAQVSSNPWHFFVGPEAGLSANWYISPDLRLTLNYSLTAGSQIGWGDPSVHPAHFELGFNQSMNFNLIYSLF
jgi:hypothetical protein